jgi:hypothetical protein
MPVLWLIAFVVAAQQKMALGEIILYRARKPGVAQKASSRCRVAHRSLEGAHVPSYSIGLPRSDRWGTFP